MADIEYNPLILAELKRELRQIGNKTGKDMGWGTRNYSVNDILNGLEKGSKLGDDHYMSYVQTQYWMLPKSPKGLRFKEISHMVLIEQEAKRLGLTDKVSK